MSTATMKCAALLAGVVLTTACPQTNDPAVLSSDYVPETEVEHPAAPTPAALPAVNPPDNPLLESPPAGGVNGDRPERPSSPL